MQASPDAGWFRLFLVFCVATLVLGLGACYAFLHQHRTSLYALQNLAGPTAQSLIERHTFTVCSVDMDTAAKPAFCLNDSRMPVAGVLIAGFRRTVGDDTLRAGLVKTVLMLVPVWLGAFAVFSSVNPRRAVWVLILLLIPFFATPLLADVVNLQVEEGYTYSTMMLAVVLLLFPDRWIAVDGRAHWMWLLLFGLSVDLVYLAKSSMIAVVAVLLLWGAVLIRSGAQRLLLCLLVLAAPIGWMIHAHSVSGRYAIGTSLDGINFHKGNNAKFLDRFPPKPGVSLDLYDRELNGDRVFRDEWEYNDYHLKEGKQFLLEHPEATATGWWRKFNTMFFTMEKVGSTENRGVLKLAETAGLLILRLFFWAAVVVCCMWLTQRGDRLAGVFVLVFFAAAALPYLAGFGYTRHISVLLLPAALVLCRYAAPGDRVF